MCLRVWTRPGEGSGSASVLANDGLPLTSAQVVGSTGQAEAAFSDGTDQDADVIG